MFYTLNFPVLGISAAWHWQCSPGGFPVSANSHAVSRTITGGGGLIGSNPVVASVSFTIHDLHVRRDGSTTDRDLLRLPAEYCVPAFAQARHAARSPHAFVKIDCAARAATFHQDAWRLLELRRHWAHADRDVLAGDPRGRHGRQGSCERVWIRGRRRKRNRQRSPCLFSGL